MRRAKEVQVVFKDCQDKDATERTGTAEGQ